MRKLLAWVAACVLALMPLSALAYESLADKALEAGRQVTTTVTFTPGTFSLLGEKEQAAYHDLLNALKLVTVAQDSDLGDVNSFDMFLGEERVLSFAGMEKDDVYTVTSSLLGGQALSFTDEELLPGLERIASAVSQMFGGEPLELDLASLAQTLEARMEGADEALAEYMPVLEAAAAYAAQLAEKAVVTQETVTASQHDAADTVVSLTLTPDEIAGLYEVAIQELLKVESFTAMLAAQPVTTEDGATLTGQEAADYMAEQMRRFPALIRDSGADDVEIRLLTAAEELVAMDVKLAFPETADGGAFTYLRKTSGENAKHTFNFTVTVEGETLAVDCAAEITADDLTGLETAFALGSESLHFIFAKNDSQTAMDWSLEAAMTSEGQNTQLLHLAYAVQGEKQGDEIGEESVLSLSVMGMPLLAVNVEKISAPAQALPDGADQVRVAAMADEELNTWVSQTLTTALTSLATLTQKLPASVLQLMMNQE